MTAWPLRWVTKLLFTPLPLHMHGLLETGNPGEGGGGDHKAPRHSTAQERDPSCTSPPHTHPTSYLDSTS